MMLKSKTMLVAALLAVSHFLSTRTMAAGEKPDDNRFTVVPLTEPNDLNEPMVFEVAKDGRTFIIERRGGIKVYDPSIPAVKPVGRLSVNNEVRNGNGEQGLVGLTLDPGFEENGWIYLYYFHPTKPTSVLSRWKIEDDTLVANSETVMMEWESQRDTCCHTGGGMDWDGDGNLFVTIGNNRGNNLTSHTDERPGRSSWDDQGGSANSNSLEGKIVRIHPEPDGTYTIPEGNLFPPGTPNTRPEIYTMGHRNAWRVSVDSATGYIYWGEVGPDVRQASEETTLSYDEFNQARGPGYFGWPYFIGPDAYPVYDYAENKAGPRQDPMHPMNDSPNNTGIRELPPMAPPFIYYPYEVSEKFPELGAGGRSATGGPIYHRSDFENPARPYPEYYEGKWLAAEFSRRMIVAIEMDEDGNYKGMERFLPDYRPVEPIDAKFGPDGDLYVLEYGGRWFQASPEARLVRIEYEGGNRKPIAVASADRKGGIPPFPVRLSSEGSEDFDHDPLGYRWDVIDAFGSVKTFSDANPKVTLEEEGVYVARLTVTDPSGESDSRSVNVVSGNEPPEVSVRLGGNQSFYFPGVALDYSVEVSDREDGSISSRTINPNLVGLSIDYVSADFDFDALENLDPTAEAAAGFPAAQALMTKGNCAACHLTDRKLVGPAFLEVAGKYRDNPEAVPALAKKIVTGGAGVWGPVAMPPNAAISETDANTILKFVLSLGGENTRVLPAAGSYTPELPEGDDGSGSFVLRAVYTDMGGSVAHPLTGQSIRVLRSPGFAPGDADTIDRVELGRFGASVSSGGRLVFRNVDFTGVRAIGLTSFAMGRFGHTGGEVEVRLGSSLGRLVGSGRIEVGAGEQGSRNVDVDAPRRRGRRVPVEATIHIEEVSGIQDLCLVFKNADDADATLFGLSRIRLSGTTN